MEEQLIPGVMVSVLSELVQHSVSQLLEHILLLFRMQMDVVQLQIK